VEDCELEFLREVFTVAATAAVSYTCMDTFEPGARRLDGAAFRLISARWIIRTRSGTLAVLGAAKPRLASTWRLNACHHGIYRCGPPSSSESAAVRDFPTAGVVADKRAADDRLADAV